ncbi:uncharacterized protein ACBR49_008906 [Aulostomus maculatus]
MSEVKSHSFSESLLLDDTETGVVIKGITDDTVVAKSGLQAGDEIVAATIHLDHLNKNEVLNILKVLEPYDNNMKVLTKKDLSASAGLGSLDLGLKDPAQMLGLKTDLDASANTPAVSLDGLSGKLNTAQSLRGEINGPSLNEDLPSFSLNKPSADAGAKITMPSLGLTGPDLKGDIDGSLKAPNVSVSAPDIDTPSASLDIEKPEIKTGKYKAPKFSMPHFDLPQIKTRKTDISGDVDLPSVNGNLETSGLNLSTPKLDLNSPKVDLDTPDISIDTPNIDTFKWPHQKLKAPKLKGPDADLNAELSAPDVNFSTPKINGDLSTPDIDLPKCEIKGPDLDVKTPNLAIDTPSGPKINWPHLRLRKPKANVDANLSSPDIDLFAPPVEGALKAPDVDINLPKADLEGPDLDAKLPNGKFKWPHQKWKMHKLKGSKPDLDIDASLNVPDLDLQTPNIEGNINAPNAELNLPNADLKGPDIDVQGLDLDSDIPSTKFTWPHKKWKKPKFHAPKGDMDLNADLSTPDIDLSVPKIDGEINTPDVDLTLPTADVDVKAPNADIEVPSVNKPRFSTLKMPKFHLPGPKVKTPDVDLDADVKTPDLSLSLPQASLDEPGVDLKADIEAPSGKKWPTLKKPKWSVTLPKVNGPNVDADVSAPDLSVSVPNADAEIEVPDVNLNAPKTEIEGPKLKWFKKPKFGTLKGLNTDIDADMNVPDVDLKGPDVDLSTPDVNFSAPKIETPDLDISMPKADIACPDMDINGPNLNIDSTDGGIKLPKVKIPKWPKVKGPDLDADVDLKAPNFSLPPSDIDASLDAPDLDINLPNADVDLQGPNADASGGKFKFSKIKIPKFGISGPKVKGPDVNVDTEDLDLDLNAPSFTAPDPNLSVPKIDGDLTAPDLGIILPCADLKEPDVDVDTSLKMPSIKMPKWNIGQGKTQLPDAKIQTPDASLPDVALNLDTTAETDVGIDVNNPSGKLKTPNLNLPKLNLFGTKSKGIDLYTDLQPNIDLSGTKANLLQTDLKGPSFDLPNADLNLNAPDLSLDGNLSAPSIDTKLPASDIQGDFSAPRVDIDLPNADLKASDVQLKTPDLEMDSHVGDFKLPHFKLPSLGLSNPEVDVPSVNPSIKAGVEAPKFTGGIPTAGANVSAPAVDLSAPKLEADVKGPEIDVEAPNINADLEKPKLNFKFPKLSLPGSKTKAPEINTKLSADGEISSPNVNVSTPEIKAGLNTPEMDITAEGEVDVKSSPKSKLRWPFKWGLKSGSDTDEEGGAVDSETNVSDAEEGVPKFRFHRLPKPSVDGVGGLADIIGLSRPDTEERDYVVSKGIRLPVPNAKSKTGEKVDIVELLKMAKEKTPSTNVTPTEMKTNIDLRLPASSLEASTSSEAGDSTLVRGGTFKIEKPESALGLIVPDVSSSDENEKLSVGLSNMLGLDLKESEDN